MPYYIYTAGGVTDLSERFVLEEAYEQSGSYNLSYVSSINGTLYTYLYSMIKPEWKVTKISNYKIEETETDEDIHSRALIDLGLANQTATLVAYNRAGKKADIVSFKTGIAVIEKDVISSEPLMIGDMILLIDGKEIRDLDSLFETVELKPSGTDIVLTIERDQEIRDITVTTRKTEDDITIIGLALYEILTLDTDPKIDFTFSLKESGPSAGFMISLAIYDSLIEEDLTNGYKIAGSGTIDKDGTVGEIGGVEFKLLGAEKSNCQIFFAPNGTNYDTAIKVKEEKNLKIDVIGVTTIDDAIQYLRSLKS